MPESKATMQIYLLRHGIAEDAEPGQADGERALTSEGKKRLRPLLKMAAAAGLEPELIMCSPYRRAIETAQIASEELSYLEPVYQTKALLPSASPEEVWDEIRLHKEAAQVLLAGHEPCIGQAAAFLLGAPSVLIDVKKGSLIRIDLHSFPVQPRGVLKWMAVPKLAG